MYRTEPVDYADQAWFLNCVIKIETGLTPGALLGRIQSVQRAAGRPEASVRFGPRLLDLDILLYDQLVLERPGLSIPHPRMHRRRFVLIPLCDIDPGIVHPRLGMDASSLLAALDEEGQGVVEYR
jgi:2-amino-4-hydroxy-6-hydroxymethyldihydropteridine diphosphokinase